MSPEMARHSPLIYPNDMSPQQSNGTSRYHSRAQDDVVGRKHLAHPAPTKWELKIESMLHSVSARQNQNDHTNQEIRSLRQEVTALQQHLQEARHRVYAAQSAVAEKQSHVEQLSTRIGENARTAQMYEGSLAARNADLAYCRGRIEHLESILLANQKFIADLQAKVNIARDHLEIDPTLKAKTGRRDVSAKERRQDNRRVSHSQYSRSDSRSTAADSRETLWGTAHREPALMYRITLGPWKEIRAKSERYLSKATRVARL